jgi:DNA-binding transcriptional LysR family regulator
MLVSTNRPCKDSYTVADFDWNDLRSFLAVARTGRLTVAALQLGIDHSTLSRRITALEKALATRLFDRQPTGYGLTRSGEQLMVEAEAIESLTLRITATVAEANAGVTGPVRIATPEGLGTYFLAGHLKHLAARYPGLRIELLANPAMVSLTKREADIAVTMSRPQQGRLRARRLLEYELGLYGSAAYLADLGEPATLDAVAGHRLIGYVPGLLPTPSHDYLKELFGTRPVDIAISNIVTQLQATVGGAGLCVLPCFMARAHGDLVRVLHGSVRVRRSYWLVMHAEMRAPALSRAVSSFLHELAQQHRSLFEA